MDGGELAQVKGIICILCEFVGGVACIPGIVGGPCHFVSIVSHFFAHTGKTVSVLSKLFLSHLYFCSHILLTNILIKRLDSAVMHVSIIQAGTLLARLCRPEVENCIRGLQQYSYAYEECTDQAQEIAQLYKNTCAGIGDAPLNHMASTMIRAGPGAVQDTAPIAPANNSPMGMTFDQATLTAGFSG